MKWIKIFGLLMLPVLVLTACSSKAYVQKDSSVNLAAYRSYAWVDTRNEQGDTVGRFSNISDLTDRQIKEAVNAGLSNAGLRQSNRDPDLLVAYDVLKEKGLHQTNNAAYGPSFNRWYYNPYSHGWYSLYYPSQLIGYNSAGYQDNDETITISLIDVKSNKTVWQGWTTNHSNSRRLTSKEIQSSVRSIFRKFDVANN